MINGHLWLHLYVFSRIWVLIVISSCYQPVKSNALLVPRDNGKAVPARLGDPTEVNEAANVVSCAPPPITDDDADDNEDEDACGGGDGGGATVFARLRTSSMGTMEGYPCTPRSKTPKESTLITPPS